MQPRSSPECRSEAERDLRPKLIGGAEKRDVAGKRRQNAALSTSTVIRRI
jgi:hypothetical protein